MRLVRADHPIRFIDAYIDSLDLASLGFDRAVAAETGRPGYDPADLPELYVYGYLNDICSSRKLERETMRNVELMWLLAGYVPTSRRSRSFVGRTPAAVRPLFREFTLLCEQILHAVDQRIESYSTRANHSDRAVDGPRTKEDAKTQLEALRARAAEVHPPTP